MKDYRKWTKEEENIVIDILNSYPGNNTYCFLLASEKINRTPNAIYEKYRLNKKDWDKRIILTPKGIRTPIGVLRYIKDNPPTFTKITKYSRLIHIIFNGV